MYHPTLTFQVNHFSELYGDEDDMFKQTYPLSRLITNGNLGILFFSPTPKLYHKDDLVEQLEDSYNKLVLFERNFNFKEK